MASVNTNAAAITALRTLQNTNASLDKTQQRISTGYKIGEAKDNAAYWAISTTLKSDNKSLGTVKDALNLGASTVDTAYQGINKAKDVLDEIKAKLTAATQDGVNRNTIQNEISQLQDQLKSIASSSIFSGENWLSVDSSVSDFSATKSIVASFSRDASNSVSIGTVKVDISGLTLFDANPAKAGIVNGTKALTASDGTLLTVGGIDATGTVPNTQGLTSVTAQNGTGSQSATHAVASLGTLNLVGLDKTDRISFNLAVDGSSPITVTFKPASVTNQTTFVSSLQSAVDTAIGTGKVTVAVDASNNVTLTSANSGGTSAVAVTGLTAIDGDGTTTGLLGTAIAATPAVGSATAAKITTAASDNTYTALSGSDTITFKFQYGSRTYQATLNATNTAGTTEAAYMASLQNAIDNATDLNGGAALGGGHVTVTAGSTAHSFDITTVAKGADQAVGVFDVQTSGASATTLNGHVGLTTINTVSGTSAAAAYTFASNIDTSSVQSGDRVAMDVTFTDAAGTAGTHNSTVYISTAGITSGNAAGDKAAFVTNAQAAVDAAFGAGKIVVDNNGGKLRFTTVAQGTNATITVANVRGVDGNGVATTTLGLSNASAVGQANTTVSAATLTTGAAFTGPQTFSDQNVLSFNLSIDGGTATKLTIDKATINAALGVTNGTITSASDFATVVNKALQNASLNTVVTATVNGSNQLVLTKSSTGVGSLAIDPASVVASAGADSLSVDKIDISDATMAARGVNGTNRGAVLKAYISLVNDAINKVTAAAASLGSVASRIDMQKSFVDTLMDTIDKGVGNLIDADMSEESTKLQALQVKQQLGVQSLSIANQSSQTILSLFRS